MKVRSAEKWSESAKKWCESGTNGDPLSPNKSVCDNYSVRCASRERWSLCSCRPKALEQPPHFLRVFLQAVAETLYHHPTLKGEGALS
jgi:hypothetical protein